VTRLAPFRLHRPTSVAEATAMLGELGDGAAVYAGGTELLLLLKLGLAQASELIDLKRIPGLDAIAVDAQGTLSIGATATHRRIERSPIVMAGWPALAAVEGVIANIRVRTTGTLGGNLCFADPHSDPATLLLAADARVIAGSGDARRSLPLGEFLVGPWETTLRPAELLLAIEVPPMPAGSAMAHQRFRTHERPTATVSCLVRVAAGRIAEARIAVGSVGPRPVRCGAAERLVTGLPAGTLDPTILHRAGEAAASAAEPDTDSNGSAAYKADLVAVLVERALRDASARATAGGRLPSPA
jgi:carbon-monoxide dehydrogenase medium subunit